MDRTFRSMWAVPNKVIFCIWSGQTLKGRRSRCFMNSVDVVPSAPTTTGITLVLVFHIRAISISRSLYLLIFSTSFLETFTSAGTATSTRRHSCFFRLWIMMSGRFAPTVRSVLTGMSYIMTTSSTSIDLSGLCSYHFSGTEWPSSLSNVQ